MTIGSSILVLKTFNYMAKKKWQLDMCDLGTLAYDPLGDEELLLDEQLELLQLMKRYRLSSNSEVWEARGVPQHPPWIPVTR